MGELSGNIKFKDRKAITKPFSGVSGFIKIWEISESQVSKEYFTYKGVRYNLVSSTEVN